MHCYMVFFMLRYEYDQWYQIAISPIFKQAKPGWVGDGSF